MPERTSTFKNTKRISHVFVHLMEIQYARIVVVLARKEGKREICRVDVCKGMSACVATTSEIQIESADACAMVVNDNHLEYNVG